MFYYLSELETTKTSGTVYSLYGTSR